VDGASSDIKGKAGTLPNLFYVSAEDKLKNRCDWLDATSSDIKAEDDGMHRPDWEKLTYMERYIKLDTGRPRLDGHIPRLPIRVLSHYRNQTQISVTANPDTACSVTIYLDPRPHVGVTLDMIGASARYQYAAGSHVTDPKGYFINKVPKKFRQYGIDGLVWHVDELHSKGSSRALVGRNDIMAVSSVVTDGLREEGLLESFEHCELRAAARAHYEKMITRVLLNPRATVMLDERDGNF
jgi:hypothetical protein